MYLIDVEIERIALICNFIVICCLFRIQFSSHKQTRKDKKKTQYFIRIEKKQYDASIRRAATLEM